MRRLLALSILCAVAPRGEARPVEAVAADRAAAAAELRDLDRRAAALDEQIALRQRLLRRRLRALYKVAQGGAVQLLVSSRGPEELAQRLDAARRIVGRDLQELGALDEEMAELDRDRAHREAGEAALVDEAASPRMSEVPAGLERLRGQLPRPVEGAIVVGLQRVRVGTTTAPAPLELPRRTVELAAVTGEAVHAIAAGEVRWAGELEGLGRAVAIDHGDHYVTVTGRLAELRVERGAKLRAGDVLGSAAGPTVTFELSEGRTALDPAGWLRPPKGR